MPFGDFLSGSNPNQLSLAEILSATMVPTGEQLAYGLGPREFGPGRIGGPLGLGLGVIGNIMALVAQKQAQKAQTAQATEAIQKVFPGKQGQQLLTAYQVGGPTAFDQMYKQVFAPPKTQEVSITGPHGGVAEGNFNPQTGQTEWLPKNVSFYQKPSTAQPRAIPNYEQAGAQLGFGTDSSKYTAPQWGAIQKQMAANRLAGERPPRPERPQRPRLQAAYDTSGNLVEYNLDNPTAPPIPIGGGAGLTKSIMRGRSGPSPVMTQDAAYRQAAASFAHLPKSVDDNGNMVAIDPKSGRPVDFDTYVERVVAELTGKAAPARMPGTSISRGDGSLPDALSAPTSNSSGALARAVSTPSAPTPPKSAGGAISRRPAMGGGGRSRPLPDANSFKLPAGIRKESDAVNFLMRSYGVSRDAAAQWVRAYQAAA